MREICMSGSTRGQWVAARPSLTVLLYRPILSSPKKSSAGASAQGYRPPMNADEHGYLIR